MNDHLWNDREGWFGDGDLHHGEIRPVLTAASVAPLVSGIASQQQADASAEVVRDRLLAPGGLRTTLVRSGQRWDSSNGWAPRQWIAVAGLHRYGHFDLANQIAARSVDKVKRVYARTGLLFEKYDVERRQWALAASMPPDWAGWTDGVTADSSIKDRKAPTHSPAWGRAEWPLWSGGAPLRPFIHAGFYGS